jgi:hypothetical protein
MDDLRLPRNGRADCGWLRLGGYTTGEEPEMDIELKASHLSILQRPRKGQAQNSTVIRRDLPIARSNLRNVRTVLDRTAYSRTPRSINSVNGLLTMTTIAQ